MNLPMKSRLEASHFDQRKMWNVEKIVALNIPNGSWQGCFDVVSLLAKLALAFQVRSRKCFNNSHF